MFVLGAIVLWLANGCSAVAYDNDGQYAYLVTAAHCVKAEGDVVDASWKGKKFGCRVLAVDRVRDLALLKCYVEHVGNVKCPVVSPLVGEELVLVGFPGGNLHVTSGTLTASLVPGTRSNYVAGTDGVEPGFSGGGVFSSRGLVGVVTHKFNVADRTLIARCSQNAEATADCKGAGCSIVDRILDRQTDRIQHNAIVSAEQTLTPGLRDLVVAALGWFLRFYVPGQSMLTVAQHKEKLDAVAKGT